MSDWFRPAEAVREVDVLQGWTPRPYQQAVWDYLARGGTRVSLAWHRRSGKDDLCLRHAACASQERVGSIWHLLPEYAQARKSIWDAVNPHTGRRRIDEAFPIEMRAATRDQEMFIQFKNGSTWQLAGSDHYNSLVGSSPCGLVFSEYALADPAAWAYLRPIVQENKGWALFISTPRGHNHFYDLHRAAAADPTWFCESLGNSATGVFSPDQMSSELREMQAQHGEIYGRSFFLQEYEVSFEAALMGSIWGDCLETCRRQGRIRPIVFDPSAGPVQTAWDLGRTDDTAVWFYQLVGQEILVFDYHASNMQDIPYYLRLLREKRHEYSLTYGTHWLPHDARPRTLAGGGKSILQQFHEGGGDLGRFAIGPRLDRQEGIQAARATFPSCVFDEVRCAKGLEALGHYHREWDDTQKIFSANPAHDWCLTGDTAILTRDGTYPIMDLPPTGEVLTLCGWKPYTHPRITRRDAPLVRVVFSDGHMVTCTPDHLFMTESGWTFAEALRPTSRIQSSLTCLRSISMVASTVCGRVTAIFHEGVKNCIERSGRGRLGLFRKAVTSITETTTLAIINWLTWSVSLPCSIWRHTTHTPPLRLPMTRDAAPPNGIALKRDDYGIDVMPSARKGGRSGCGLRSAVHTVKRCFRGWSERVGIAKFIARRNAKWLRIVRVDALHETADVWCLTVPEIEHFSLSNGAIVHNSSHASDAFRYLSLSWKRPKVATPEAPFLDKLMAKSQQTWGAVRQRHLEKARLDRTRQAVL